MQSSDIAQIIVAVIGVIGVVVSKVGKNREKEKNNNKPPREVDKWAIGMYFCMFVIMADFGFWGWRYLAPTKVKITYPINYGSMERTEMIRGTSKRVPREHAIWVVVFPHEANLYYPQNSPANVQKTGDWTSLAYIGIEKDVGRKFDIAAVVADKTAQDSFRAYLAGSIKKGWSGLEKLPEGAPIYDCVTATRK